MWIEMVLCLLDVYHTQAWKTNGMEGWWIEDATRLYGKKS